jgi:GNAT superfamily N-acetyltransferase
MTEPQIQIRRAALADLDTVLAMIQRDSFGYQREDPARRADYVKAFEDIEASPNDELIVATRGGEVVGTLQLTFIPGLSYRGGWRVQVEAVRVRDDLRSLGIGTQLMEWVFAQARERGCRLVQLTTNVARKDAQRFYQRLGFTPSHVGMKLIIDP